MELWEYSAWRLAEFVTRGQLSVSEVVEAHLTHLQWQEGIYHALITPLVESARERARILDTALATLAFVRKNRLNGGVRGGPAANDLRSTGRQRVERPPCVFRDGGDEHRPAGEDHVDRVG